MVFTNDIETMRAAAQRHYDQAEQTPDPREDAAQRRVRRLHQQRAVYAREQQARSEAPNLRLSITLNIDEDDVEHHSWSVGDGQACVPSCRKPLHQDVWAGGRMVPCPCDVACPTCGEAVGQTCQTPSRYTTRPHRQRIAASPRSATTRCEHGLHAWAVEQTWPTRPTTATCTGCGITAPIEEA